jgi:cholesterol transport system auxiliary component
MAAVLTLAGCVSLLPKAEPAQLYRFQANLPAAGGPSTGPRVEIALAPVQFAQAASSDRLLTVNGSEAAFIADSRWVAPADVLFRENLLRAFDSAGVARLADRAQAPASSMTMDVAVNDFEAQYRSGMNAAPTVVIQVNARLIRDRAIVGEKRFTGEAQASDNRMSAIVPAYNEALTQVLKDMVAWADQTASQTPPAPQ